MIDFEQEAQRSATGGAEGYTEQMRAAFSRRREDTLRQAPNAQARDAYSQWADSYDVNLAQRSAVFQAQSTLAKRSTDFAAAMNAHEQAILSDPAQFDTVYARAMDDLAGARTWMTPEQEAEAREKVDNRLKTARAKHLAEMKPAQFLAEVVGEPPVGDAAVSYIVDRIIGAESSGDPTARNPKSSAGGLGQFIDSTWLATVRRYRPDVAAGKTAREIIALKTDPAFAKLSREMTTAYTKENAKALTATGLPVTPGNLYLAHFAGAGGARAVLSADNGASVADVLGPGVVNANGFLRGKSVGWLKDWAAKKMGDSAMKFAEDPRYAGLSVDQILQLRDQAAGTLRAEQMIADAATRTQYTAYKDAFELQIMTGRVASDQAILSDPMLNDGDKATLLRTFRTEMGKTITAAADLEAFREGGLRVDPFDTQDRDRVDNLFGEVTRRNPEQLETFTEEIVRQTGIVPKAAISLLRQGMESTEVGSVIAAGQAAQRLASINPSALGRREGGKELQAFADDFAHYVQTVNMSPEDAARKIIEARDPRTRLERRALEPMVGDYLKELDEYNLPGEFDASFLGIEGNASLGFDPRAEAGIRAEFKAIAEDQFYKSGGDGELATARAVAEMKRLYGVTAVTGRPVIIRHAPEMHWPKYTFSEFGDTLVPAEEAGHDYARFQLRRELEEMWPGVDMDRVQLVTTPETDRMVKNGEMPGYAVMYRDENGVLQTVPGKLWRPDVTEIGRSQSTLDKKRETERVERARREDEILRGEAVKQERLQQRQSETGESLRGGPMVDLGLPDIEPPVPPEFPIMDWGDAP